MSLNLVHSLSSCHFLSSLWLSLSLWVLPGCLELADFLAGSSLFLAGWSLFLAGWCLFLTSWSLFPAGWSLFLAGCNLFMAGWSFYWLPAVSAWLAGVGGRVERCAAKVWGVRCGLKNERARLHNVHPSCFILQCWNQWAAWCAQSRGMRNQNTHCAS